MNSGVVLHAEQLGKRFTVYSDARARLAQWLRIPGVRGDEFWALRDITFDLLAGDTLGIIGVNGAGKSTLLKILSGVLYPTSGSVTVVGRVVSLLELGTGFAPELSGRDNVRQSVRLLGLPRLFLSQHEAAIEEFAELGEYFDRPIKLYSSGMLVRLAFSLYSAMEPEIFIVDEVLAVGDLRFAARAIGRIKGMLARGTTLLFVSHDLQLVNQLCSRAIWLDGGRIAMDDSAAHVTRAYQQFVVHAAHPVADAPAEQSALPATPPGEPATRTVDLHVESELAEMHRAIARARPIDNAPAQIVRVATYDVRGQPCVEFRTHEPLVVRITVRANADVVGLVTGIQVRDMSDRMLWTTRPDWQKVPLPQVQAGQTITVAYETDRLRLGGGQYQLTVACHQYPRDDRVFHWIDGIWRFNVRTDPAGHFNGPLDFGWRVEA